MTLKSSANTQVTGCPIPAVEKALQHFCTAANLIKGEPDGLHVFSLPPFLPAVLLHEANQEAAV